MILTATLLISFFKLLLIPAYRSTDFEVHRNWLAITKSLPVGQWYYDETSPWTLDYPPLFAWFEYLLSFPAALFDVKMLDIHRLNYTSDKTVLFQRLSVILVDLVYILGVHMCCSVLQKSWRRDVVLPILLIANCGLIMIDHIHFQYNGMMFGVLLISVANLMEGKMLSSSFWFTMLLNLKHIYIYLAPAYFIYLLKHYCLGPSSFKSLFTLNVIKKITVLGLTVIGVFAVTFAPFYQHLPQILSRLFPFKRGLCHAYWAPNFWAIYNIVDKMGFAIVSKYSKFFCSRSTDFEVHRNWLAITKSLPVGQWYYDETSPWTLDYPPLFAWFEYLLSFPAALFDVKMLDIHRLNYTSDKTVLFQRLSVILVDLVYILGVHMCCSVLQKSWRRDVVLPILLIANCGLIMIDHIHFQYNGMMFGVLLISVANLMEGKMLSSSFWFTMLLNLKHIYIYLAPAYFIYLLKHYCLGPSSFKSLFTLNVIKKITVLGLTVIGVFAVTFAPFYQHLPQILSRLFPFKRGLCHAYWAPNFWAIYNIVDKMGFAIASKLDLSAFKKNITASMTGGLVQDITHDVLPNITPLMTMLLTILFMVPAMVKLFSLSKQPMNFLRCMVICGLTSFMFGWHVHEKAILMAIIPLTILSIMEKEDAKIFLILSTVGHYSLFPLLFPPSLLLVKVLLLLLYTLYAFHSLYIIYPLSICKYSFPLLNPLESLYLLGLCLVFAYENVIHYVLGLSERLPFLPLLITSVYCSFGVMYCWIRFYVYFLQYKEKPKKRKNSKQNKVK